MTGTGADKLRVRVQRTRREGGWYFHLRTPVTCPLYFACHDGCPVSAAANPPYVVNQPISLNPFSSEQGVQGLKMRPGIKPLQVEISLSMGRVGELPWLSSYLLGKYQNM